ncbi:hypothetical protein ScPMuIL_008213 [Solemya velum]
MLSVDILLLVCLVPLTAAGETCLDTWGSFRWCEHGCCGVDDEYCCDDDNIQTAVVLGVGSIISIVIGVCIFIGGAIAIICCCVRRRGYTGNVMTRQQVPAMVYTSQTTQMPPGMYGVQPGYNQPQMAHMYPPTQPLYPPPYSISNLQPGLATPTQAAFPLSGPPTPTQDAFPLSGPATLPQATTPLSGPGCPPKATSEDDSSAYETLDDATQPSQYTSLSNANRY